MRIFKKYRTTARAFVGEADIVASSVRLDLSNDPSPVVRASFRLQAASASDKHSLSIDFSHCPLVPMEVAGKAIGNVQLSQAVANEGINLRLQDGTVDILDGSEVTVSMRWSASSSHPPLLDRKFFYAPEELPIIGGRAGSFAPLSQVFPVTVDARSDGALVGAIASNLAGIFDSDGPQLQAVLCTELHAYRSKPIGESVEICILTDSPTAEKHDTLQPMCFQIRGMAKYFAERLHASPGLRIAVALDSKEKSPSMFGALLTAPRSWYRSKDKNHQSKEFPIARMVANIWWGAGCRVSGDRGVHLANGIAFAIALAWTRSSTSVEYFERQISYFREHIVSGFTSSWSKSGPGERTVPIGMAIFDGLVASDSVWHGLAKLTQDYWGREAPEDQVLHMLQAAGVEVGDFERNRFRI